MGKTEQRRQERSQELKCCIWGGGGRGVQGGGAVSQGMMVFLLKYFTFHTKVQVPELELHCCPLWTAVCLSLTLMALMSLVCPLNVCLHCPSLMSHSLARESQAPEMKVDMSGDRPRDMQSPMWLVKTTFCFPVSRSHRQLWGGAGGGGQNQDRCLNCYDQTTIRLRPDYDQITIRLRSDYDQTTIRLRSDYDQTTISLRSDYVVSVIKVFQWPNIRSIPS